jgi:hypothetical protein
MINADDFMLFLVIAGFALCLAYFRAQYRDWRRRQISEASQKSRARLLYQLDAKSACLRGAVGVRTVDPASGSVVGSFGCPGAESRSTDSGLLGARL